MHHHAIWGVSGAIGAALLLSCAPTTTSTPVSSPNPASTATPVTTPTVTPTPSPILPTPASTATPQPSASPVPSTDMDESAAPATSANAPAVSFKTDVTRVLKTHCAACHTSGGRGALAMWMFDDPDHARFEIIRPGINEIIRQIAIGRMPQRAPGTVPAADLQVLKDWQAAGSPNN